MAQKQRTIRSKIQFNGVGLHSGEAARLTLYPAKENTGIVFLKSSGLKMVEIPALYSHVVDNRLATVLANEGEIVATVEHFLAALYGLGIDNVWAEISGAELPILDGSAAIFMEQIQQVGIEEQGLYKKFWVVNRAVNIREGDKTISLRPASRLAVDCTIDFTHPLISKQSYHWEFSSSRAFYRDVAKARTFGFLKDVEQLRAQGLIRGGSLENAVVIDEFNILNPEGLRYSNEFVRHKLLDALGDISLLGRPLIGALYVHKAGHALHHRMMQEAIKSQALSHFEPEASGAQHFCGELELSLPAWEQEFGMMPT